jgi:subtilase family serine protease
MQRVFRIVMIFAIVGLFMQLPLSGWAKETQRVKTSDIVKSPAGVTQVTGAQKTAKPDLVVSKINFSPGNPTTDDEITLWVFVKNAGQGPAGASGVRVKVGGQSNPPVIQVPPLNPGQEYRYTKKVTFGKAGNYIVTVTADAANALSESNEGNNGMQKTIKVKPAPKPDLVITKINYSPGNPKQHEQVKVWIFVKNLGPGKSEKCYVSDSDSLNSVPNWHKEWIPALDPGKEYRSDALFLSNAAGTFYLRAAVDRENRIDETNENNNALERKIIVGPPAN